MSLFAAFPEDFLHFVWKHLHFDLKDLRTTAGEPIQLIQVGRHNRDQGPDFLEASLRIGAVSWYGQVEIHVNGEDWYRHGHQNDPHYNNTILHVVLQAGKRLAERQDGSTIPELVLDGRIPPKVVEAYDQLRLSENRIPCSSLLGTVPPILRQNWVDRLTIERIEQKAQQFQMDFVEQAADWEEALWKSLASYMGGPVNQDAFRQLAEYIPYKILRKYVHQTDSLEALLFGGMGSLKGVSQEDAYVRALKQEWHFLQQKHQVRGEQPIPLKFGRMRPASFPSLRLAQLAQILHLFVPLIGLLEGDGISRLLQTNMELSDYWQTHDRLGKESKARKKHLGEAHKKILVANVIVPAAFLYHRVHGRDDVFSFVEESLQSLSAENNRLTRPLAELGFQNEHAFHSQGLIQLSKAYCLPKNCLICGIGQQILKNSSPGKS